MKKLLLLCPLILLFIACEKPEMTSESDPEAYAASLKPVVIKAIAPNVTINGVDYSEVAEVSMKRGEQVSVTAYSKEPVSLEIYHNGEFYYYYSSTCETKHTYTYKL